MISSFVKIKNDELKMLKESNDVEFLKNELVKTEKSIPECAAESLFRTNKISVITNRINSLDK